MNTALLAELESQIEALNLLSYKTSIVDSAQVAVDVLLEGLSDQALGESRFSGVPDLPIGFAWPRNSEGEALTFLLQINLAQLPEWDRNPFPQTGLLSFFIGLDEPATDVEHQIFLFDADNLQKATAPVEEEFANENYLDFPPYKLGFSLRADIPHWASNDEEELCEPMEDDDRDAYEKLSRAPTNQLAQLLGHVHGIGTDPREDAFVVREHNPAWIYDYKKRSELDFTAMKSWRNLLCLFSQQEPDFCIWDAGYLNFLIHEADLQKLDLSRLYVAVESS